MSDLVKAANKIKATVHRNCPAGEDTPPCEHLVYLSVPNAGGDGLLLGVTESPEAAETIASAFNTVFSLMHTHA